MTKPTTITNGEKILATQIIGVCLILILWFSLFKTARSLDTTQTVVLSQQEIIERYEKEIDVLQDDVYKLERKEYVTPEQLEKVRMSGYNYSWEIYEEMRDFINKAESRLPVLKRI